MIDKKDMNILLFMIFWLILAIWAALDGLSLFVVIWAGVGIALYSELVKQWSSYGISWEVIVLFIGTVVAFDTALVYVLAMISFIDRQDVGLIYLAKLTPGFAGMIVYVAFQAKLLRQQHRQIQQGLRRINGDKS